MLRLKRAERPARSPGALENAMTAEESVLPAHVEDTIETIARLHMEHREAASGLQRTSEQITAFLGRPLFIVWLSIAFAAWLGAGWAMLVLTGRPLDPAFQGLQTVTSIAAVYMTAFILIAQRRDDALAELREKLTLELAILSAQKIAKVIALMEELRRDLPSAPDRGDPEADALSSPADAQAVVEALREEGSAGSRGT
jgi:uncharacterized membrane protein